MQDSMESLAVANRLERRRPRLHECEARKGSRDVESATFDAAEATALQAGTPAFQSHPPPIMVHSRLRFSTTPSERLQLVHPDLWRSTFS